MAPFFTSLLGFGSRTIGGLGRAIMNPIKKVGGLLGNAGKAGAYYGLGNALFGGNNNEEQIQSGGSGGGEMGGFGGTVSGATPVSTAASATSALSDADSSDPVVRQLQDIERVLVSIKGDTSQFVGGMSRAAQAGPNKNALRNMFGRSGGGIGPAAAGGLGLASLFALGMAGKMGDNDKGDTEAGTQERFDATIGNELEDFGATAGMKAAGIAAGAAGERASKAAIEAGANRAGKMAASTIDTSTGGVKFDRNGTAMNKAGDEVHGAAKESARQSMEKLQKEAAEAASETAAKNPQIAAKITASIAKNLGQTGAKVLPFVGAGFNLIFAMEKAIAGDWKGAALETAGMIPFAGIGADVGSLVRDVYKDVYDVFPEDDSENYEERFPELFNMVTSAIADLMSSNMDNAVNDLEAVEARPEVSDRMTGRRRGRALERQRSWDNKYGNTHNADGSVKAELLESAVEARIDTNPDQTTSMMDAAIETGQEALGGLGVDVPLNDSARVEDMTTSSFEQTNASSNDALVAALGGMPGATAPVQGGQGEISVHVSSPKTSFPQSNSELTWINSNASGFV